MRWRQPCTHVPPETVANEAVITQLASDTIELLRNHEPGYAAVTPAATSAVALARELGVKLETTYTGRAFAALLADADVLFWDTYNSAPMPPPGREDSLPPALREFLARSLTT
jgi:hypothetical protein